MNTEAERKIIICEKSLLISDNVNFERRKSRVVKSKPYVTLKGSNYPLSANITNSSNFSELEMYAKSNGKTLKYNLDEETANWKTISIERIAIKKGVEIGFLANAAANSFCYINDGSLVRE